MPQNRRLLWPIVTAVIAVFVILVSLPGEWKTWAPGFIRNPSLHLGLDLAGGTQLDFRISEEEMQRQLREIDEQIAQAEQEQKPLEEIDALNAQRLSIQEQQRNLVEAIRNVLERRINALGVSESTITPSYVGDEKHLLVECPGVVDTQECIQVVGKTIQLEFKEEYTGASEDFRREVEAKVASAERRMAGSGHTLQKVGQDFASELGVTFADEITVFRDQLPAGLEDLWDGAPNRMIRREGSLTLPRQDDQGQIVEQEVPGIFLAASLGPRTQTGRVIDEAPRAFEELTKTESDLTYAYRENLVLDAQVDPRVTAALRDMQPGGLKSVALDGDARVLFLRQYRPGGEQMEASHILVGFQGATSTDASVTRTKEEALARANQLKTQLDQGANFTNLARTESDGPSKADGGKLGAFARGVMAPAFEQAAFALKQGQISEPVETQFGYHIIRADKEAAQSPATADVDVLTVKGATPGERAQTIVDRLQRGDIRSTEDALKLRLLFFWLQPTGWKDTPLDGKHFRSATVTLDPISNIPMVQIAFDSEGSRLFQELTKRNIGKSIAIFVGGQEVTAPRVNEEISGGIAVISGNMNLEQARLLAQDLNTGAIPAPIHLTGQYTVEPTLGTEALRTSLYAALIGIVILMLYMVAVYRLLGLVANAALLVYAFLLAALLKFPLLLVSNNYIVLTLAGMAGIILSLGMAIDANVLVFERLREEVRKGKNLRTAVESSFKYAWPAIRDGNVSTLITCVILFMIGTSIVRGFAVTLGLGVFLSMFTAITVTRWMLRRLVELPQAQRQTLYGVRPGSKA